MLDALSTNRNQVLRNVNISGSVMEKSCRPKPVCIPTLKYRSSDGSCNNLIEPRYGMASTVFSRLLPNAYADGKCLK